MSVEDINNKVKVIRYNRHKEINDKLKSIIEAFCAEKKLIIYGGLAINKYVTRAGLDPIYDEFEKVDYDVYSTNYLEDAEELGKRINDAGIHYIKIHSGFKPTTRKIYVTPILSAVIDINHVTPEQYINLEPELIDGLYYIKPHALFEDQIKNLVTNLFGDIHRIPKIIKRIEMMVEVAPVKPKKDYESSNNTHCPEFKGIIAGDFAYNYYLHGKLFGDPILYLEEDVTEELKDYITFPMEGETIYYNVEVDGRTYKLAPPALLLYFYYKLKIQKNTDDYDRQISVLQSNGFPYPNYDKVHYYIPMEREPIRYTYTKTILLE